MFAIRERVFDDHEADVGAHADLQAFGCGDEPEIRLQLIGEEVSRVCGHEATDAVGNVGLIGAFDHAMAQGIGHESRTDKGGGNHKIFAFLRDGAANLAADCSG